MRFCMFIHYGGKINKFFREIQINRFIYGNTQKIKAKPSVCKHITDTLPEREPTATKQITPMYYYRIQ